MQSHFLFRASLAFSYSLLLATATTGCTKPRQTTAIGSGVGGVIGAGLGAIVGNQTGNSGSGLAIGAGAGAAVGALVGNALQAQEERNRAQDESIKRQERVIQAQRNEINELRSIRGDDSFSYNPTAQTSARYRYRGTTIDPESPEVARQRARLQKRGPRPKNSSAPVDTYRYEPSWPRPAINSQRATAESTLYKARAADTTYNTQARTHIPAEKPPVAVLPSTTTEIHKPLARYDVRSELAASSTRNSSTTESSTNSSAVKTQASKAQSDKLQIPSGSISESDIIPAKDSALPPARANIPAPAVQAQSKECKEALSERDLAAEATENSDKLFHLRRALRLCPQSAPLHHELGKVYASMQRTKDAEEEFKEALTIDPSFSAAKRELSSLLKDEVQF